VLVAGVLAVLVAGCDGTPTQPAPAFTQTDLRVGTGDAAESGDTLTVLYTGWLYDGSKTDNKGLQFETNVGGTPFPFVLGTGDVIPGWDQGLVGIQAGGIRRLVIPPALAYGPTRRGPIPPNSTLVFEVEVTAIE
jgi:FKBP-type peptidyl-prolyl cis-trans isomerase